MRGVVNRPNAGANLLRPKSPGRNRNPPSDYKTPALTGRGFFVYTVAYRAEDRAMQGCNPSAVRCEGQKPTPRR